ncbi:MAG: glycoside hydrolase family 16 [Frankiales bacterium]|nr:glycoside hydrolase family 16 [Frankiales bacterium]
MTGRARPADAPRRRPSWRRSVAGAVAVVAVAVAVAFAVAAAMSGRPQPTKTPAAGRGAPVTSSAAEQPRVTEPVRKPIGFALRWRAGSTSWNDGHGTRWEPDSEIARGGTLVTAKTRPLLGTRNPALYSAWRVGVSDYRLPVPSPGTWAIVLHTPPVTPGSSPKLTIAADTGETVVLDTSRRVGGGRRPESAMLLVRTSSEEIHLTVTAQTGKPAVTAVSMTLESAQVGARTLAFHDEFSGTRTTPLTQYWRYDIGKGLDGWGNKELQSYTARKANVSLDGRGRLQMTALRGAGGSNATTRYTSARLHTKGTYAGRYGRIEVRAQLPLKHGLLPAIWLLGTNLPSVGWPTSGEVDLVESLVDGKGPGAYSTVHGAVLGRSQPWQLGGRTQLQQADHSRFHTYAVEWAPGALAFSIDGQQFATVTRDDLGPKDDWPFDRDAYVLISLAVGGRWPGSPPAATTFPQHMLLDYIRWWR